MPRNKRQHKPQCPVHPIEIKYARMLENIGDVVVIIDAQGINRFESLNIQRQFGWRPAEVVGFPALDNVHPDDVAQAQAFISALWREPRISHTMDCRYQCRNGRYKWIEFTGINLLNDPDIGGILGNYRDITARKQAEDIQCQFAQKLMSVREEEKRALSGILHHDIGSLTIGMLARCDAIEEDLRAGKNRSALKWLKQARHLFTESMTHFKQIAVDVRPPELDVIGLRTTLRQYFTKTAQATGIRIDFSHNLGKRCIRGPATTILFRVAQEAITNAVKHSQAKKVTVNLKMGIDSLQLVIRDRGKGFHAELAEKASRGEMGLLAMREMVAAANGAFRIDSKPGKGTRIQVRLPIGRNILVIPKKR